MENITNNTDVKAEITKFIAEQFKDGQVHGGLSFPKGHPNSPFQFAIAVQITRAGSFGVAISQIVSSYDISFLEHLVFQLKKTPGVIEIALDLNGSVLTSRAEEFLPPLFFLKQEHSNIWFWKRKIS